MIFVTCIKEKQNIGVEIHWGEGCKLIVISLTPKKLPVWQLKCS